MADEILAEIAPLLAAEGVSLTDGRTYSEQELNGALQRAFSRRNFDAFVATGGDRIAAFRAIRGAAECVWDDDVDGFKSSVAAITPDTVPTAAQAIGTTLSLLDAWFANGGVAARFGRPSFGRDRWDIDAARAGYEIHKRAKKRTAFDSRMEFIASWGGLSVLTFSMLIVFEGLRACAKPGESFDDVADRLLDPDTY